MPKTPKNQGIKPPPRPTPPPPGRSFTPMLIAALVVIVTAAIGLFAYVRGVGPDQSDQAGQAPPPQAAPATPVAAAEESAAPPPNARFGPHKQDVLPPLPFGPSPPVRPPDVVRAVYKFAAEHPEVLGYVPCYCGCERSGHRGNDDCFVTSRNANGDVRLWEPHGLT